MIISISTYFHRKLILKYNFVKISQDFRNDLNSMLIVFDDIRRKNLKSKNLQTDWTAQDQSVTDSLTDFYSTCY